MALTAVLVTIGIHGAAAGLAYLGASIGQNVAKYFLFNDKFELEKVDRSDLRAADHIIIPGSKSRSLKIKGLVGYYHHGVYLGVINGEEMVTDFGAVDKTLPVIRKLDDFLHGYDDQLYRRNYKVSRDILTPERTLEFARSICSGKHPWPVYSLNTNNCEHYATLLKMAQVHSTQATHLPQDVFYRQMIAPNLGKTILKQHMDEN